MTLTSSNLQLELSLFDIFESFTVPEEALTEFVSISNLWFIVYDEDGELKFVFSDMPLCEIERITSDESIDYQFFKPHDDCKLFPDVDTLKIFMNDFKDDFDKFYGILWNIYRKCSIFDEMVRELFSSDFYVTLDAEHIVNNSAVVDADYIIHCRTEIIIDTDTWIDEIHY